MCMIFACRQLYMYLRCLYILLLNTSLPRSQLKYLMMQNETFILRYFCISERCHRNVVGYFWNQWIRQIKIAKTYSDTLSFCYLWRIESQRLVHCHCILYALCVHDTWPIWLLWISNHDFLFIMCCCFIGSTTFTMVGCKWIDHPSMQKGKCYNNIIINKILHRTNHNRTPWICQDYRLSTQWRTTRYIHGIAIQASWLPFFFLREAKW